MSEAFPAREREPNPKRSPAESDAWTHQLLRAIVESCSDGVVAVDHRGACVLLNPAARRILRVSSIDLPPDRWAEAYGFFLPDMVTPYPTDDLPLVRALRGEAVEATEVFLRSASAPAGAWASMAAAPLRDPAGRVRGAVLTVRDVTHSKRIEESLRRERDWVSSVLDATGSLVVVRDRQGRIVSVNRACRQLTGYALDEMRGKTIWELFLLPQETPQARSVFEQICAGDFPCQHENYWVTRDGRCRRIVWSHTALRDPRGEVEYVISVGIDLTERTRAEEELRQAHESFRTLVQAAPVAIWAIDLDGNVIFWNPAAERIFGWTESEVLNRPLPIIPDDQQEDFRELLGRYRRGEYLRGLERRRRRKDGSPVDISIWSAPLRNLQGQVIAQLGVIIDVTERKQLEEQFRQAQKMEAIGRLAGGVAHDFNNLLMVISGYGHMLLEGLPPDDPLRGHAIEILRASESASDLTSRLLAFSRRQAVQPRILDLNSIVRGMDKMLHRVIGEDIELVTILAPDLAPVKADPGQIEQVLMNLVVNSRDAMPEGGRLVIRTANVCFDEEYARMHLGINPGAYVSLSVSDTGQGIDAETMRHVFEPFFTTKEKGKGTGLGLSMVYGIVKQSGGDISVSSAPGQGATFTIYLPVAEQDSAEDAPPAPARRPAGGTETILVAEDEPALRQLISEVLQREGYTVLQAGDSAEAQRLAREHPGPIHLFLTDVIMPRMSGRELALQLVSARPSLRVIYMSGYSDRDIVQEGIVNAGAVYLEKPFTAETLIAKVREVLDAANGG